MTVKLLGRDDVAASGAINANTISLLKYTAPATGVVTEIRCRVAAGVAGNTRIGIYADSSGQPGALLATTASTAISSGAARVVTIALLADLNVTAGTAYWIGSNSDAAVVGYKTEAVVHKYKVTAYAALPDPAGSGYTDDATLGDITSGWGAINAASSPPAATMDAAAPAPAVSGGSVSTPPTATVASQAIAPIVSTGVVTIVNAPTATVSVAAIAPTVTATMSVTSSPPAAAVSCAAPSPAVFLGTSVTVAAPTALSTAAAFIVVAGPLTGVTVSAPLAVASSQAFTVSTTVLFHVILEAEYFTEAPQVNHVYVVGQDAAGSPVSGSAVTQGDVDLSGERLEVQHDPAVATAAAAADVAGALLARSRLDSKKGKVTIPPHCGMELWDVVSVVDSGANQSASFRVIGYTLDYDVRQGICRHEIGLGAQ